jgi:hypothetical protein
MFQTTGESHSLFLLLYTVKGLGHVHDLYYIWYTLFHSLGFFLLVRAVSRVTSDPHQKRHSVLLISVEEFRLLR